MRLYSRQKYLENKCSRQKYYSQFITEYINEQILQVFSKEKLKAAYNIDKYFSTIPYYEWNKLWYCVNDSGLLDKTEYTNNIIRSYVLKQAAENIVINYNKYFIPINKKI